MKMKLMTTTCTTVLGTGLMLAAGLSVPVRAQVSDSDKTFLAMAAQGDMNEIKLSELAEQKASSPQVKAYAHKMVVEHTAMSAEMKPRAVLTVRTRAADGTEKTFKAVSRIDTPEETSYYRHGGILPYVLRQLLGMA